MSSLVTGIGSIGRIDHAVFSGSPIIPMHPHVNDEILTYLRSGKVEHKDSEGFTEHISKNKLMLMKAERSFFHEEKVFGEAGTLEGLQIFIQPDAKDLNPAVTFRNLENAYSLNKWRLLASPDNDTPLQFSSQTWIFDIKADSGRQVSLLGLHYEKLTVFLNVFSGSVKMNNRLTLSKMDGLIISNEYPMVVTNQESEMVLFVTDEASDIFKGGMYSGNQF